MDETSRSQQVRRSNLRLQRDAMYEHLEMLHKRLHDPNVPYRGLHVGEIDERNQWFLPIFEILEALYNRCSTSPELRLSLAKSEQQHRWPMRDRALYATRLLFFLFENNISMEHGNSAGNGQAGSEISTISAEALELCTSEAASAWSRHRAAIMFWEHYNEEPQAFRETLATMAHDYGGSVKAHASPGMFITPGESLSARCSTLNAGLGRFTRTMPP